MSGTDHGRHQAARGGIRLTRRGLIKAGGAGLAAVSLGSRLAFASSRQAGHRGPAAGYGPLREGPGGLLDLPDGFQYRVLSPEGERLGTGAPVPGDHDGMAAFPAPGNHTILVRNHELSTGDIDGDSAVPQGHPYDAGDDAPGGTTGIVVGPDRREVDSYVTSSGTERNCSGGPTPWGTWLTCEETRTEGHGFVFEALPGGEEPGISDVPLRDMGFFSHEAIGIDPATGVVYLTEDDFRGGIPADPEDEVPTSPAAGGSRSSFLYRFLPNDRRQRPGALQSGGVLQALAIEGNPRYNADLAGSGQRFQVAWKPVEPASAHEGALARGAVRFNRLEGADFRGGAFWFDDTAGGEDRLGQMFRLLPGAGPDGGDVLELFFEGTAAGDMQSPDNVVLTPFGDLWFCEDGSGTDRVVGITPEGTTYEFARNRRSDAELAGCTFSPDGRTFFVSIQSPGITFAIWGPFARRNSSRQREMAAAAPPPGLAPRIGGELAEAADRYGMTPLEASAFDRLGVPLA